MVSVARAAAAVRAVWGTLLLSAPHSGMRVAGHGRGAEVARVLAVRHLLQAAVTAAAPTRSVVAAGALHALTGLAVAVMSRTWRAAAVADASRRR